MIRKILRGVGLGALCILMLVPPHNVICWTVAFLRRKSRPRYNSITALFEDFFAPALYPMMGVMGVGMAVKRLVRGRK